MIRDLGQVQGNVERVQEVVLILEVISRDVFNSVGKHMA